ncbi:MAG: hypothetical protein CW338_08495 [Clostridiales bacterium]|nr:hypothetical protein [Clostridiales bacterium]
MKPYYKRLLIVSVTVIILLVLTGVFVRDTFQVNAGQLNLTAEPSDEKVISASRSDAFLNLDSIEDDGYDTAVADGFSLVLQDERAELYFRADTAEIALRDKVTGQVWYSNPQDRDSETMVQGTTRQRIGAQISVAYYDTKGTFCQMDSYNDCVANGSMKYEVRDNVLYVTYYLGKTTVTLSDVPQQISVARMDEFASRLNDKDRKELLGYYRVASVTGKDESYVEKMVKTYPNVINEDIYYLTKDSSRILKKIKGFMDEAGYTWEDLEYDNRVNQVETEEVSRAYFQFDVEYSLEDGKLTARLKGESMLYDEKYPPYEVSFLEYFGCGGKTEKGYFVLPDGSGSLMMWNNGKTAETPFSMRMYGNDTVSDTEGQYVIDQKISLPVFGIKNGKAALLAEVMQGEALCTLCARVAGMQNSYNTAYVTVLTTDNDMMEISTDSKQIYFEETPYRGDIVLCYTLLDEEDADYMGMARVYRQELLSRGALRQNGHGGYPLSLDIICAVPAKKTVMGISVNGIECMTGYDQIGEIADMFPEAAALWISPEGMFDGGLMQSWAKKIALESALGGKDAFRRLTEKISGDGRILIPQVWLQTAYTSSGLSTSGNCARDLCRDIAVRYYYNYISRYQNYDGRVIYQLNMKSTRVSADAAVRFADKNALTGICIPDTGTMLWSDYKRKESMNRVEMQTGQTGVLEGAAAGIDLYLVNPNAYALAYASGIMDMPCSDSAFRVTDESIPFYQAVIRGSIPYCCPSLNYGEDYDIAFLRAVEFGAGLQYTLTWQTTAVLKETDYSYINCGHIDDWKTTVHADYGRAFRVLSALDGVEMTGHRQIAKDVYETAYADGTRVYVNYSGDSYVFGGLTIPAYDFIAAEGGDGQ